MEAPTALTIISPDHPAHKKSVNPAVVYLASLGPGSRRAMRQALGVISELLTGTKADPLQVPWWEVKYQHSQAIRSLLMERYSPASANKIMAALRGGIRLADRCVAVGGECLDEIIPGLDQGRITNKVSLIDLRSERGHMVS